MTLDFEVLKSSNVLSQLVFGISFFAGAAVFPCFSATKAFKTNRGRGQRDNVRRTCASVDQQSAAASNPGTSAARGAYLAIGTIGRLIHRQPTKVTKDPPLYFAPPSCL